MKKIVRDDRGYVIGWTNTKLPKDSREEFIDGANYSFRGIVGETMKSAFFSEIEYAEDRGELF